MQRIGFVVNQTPVEKRRMLRVFVFVFNHGSSIQVKVIDSKMSLLPLKFEIGNFKQNNDIDL